MKIYKDRFPLLLQMYREIRDWYLHLKRYKYIKKIRQFCTPDMTIISSNCFAGRILQDLGREYNTPTLGLYFWAPDFIEFVSDLPRYLNSQITFVNSSKHLIGNQKRAAWEHWYPIGVLDGKIEIHFLHYHSEEEALEKWNRRVARMNLNNLLIIGMDQNLATRTELYAFDKLPYPNKIYFSRFSDDLESNEYMPEFKNAPSVGDPYKKGHIFYRHFIRHFRI